MQHASFPHSLCFLYKCSLSDIHTQSYSDERATCSLLQAENFHIKNKIEINMIMLFPFISTRSNTQSFKEEIQIM